MALSDDDRLICEGAAEIFIKPNWEPVFKIFPDLRRPILAIQEYERRSKKTTGHIFDKNNPPTNLEWYGRALRNSISNRSRAYHLKNSGKSNGRTKNSTVRHKESRSLIVIYESGCEKFGWMPSDEMMAHCANIANVSFVADCRKKLQDRWEFTQLEDGRWNAVRKSESSPFDQRISELVSAVITMNDVLMKLTSDMTKMTNGKKK
jgi:hypothetical protein